MSAFLYALKAPETRRQYPKRLKVFFDFLHLQEPLEKQASDFLSRANDNPQWAYHSFIRFMSYQKERASRGDIAESTISNYYKAAKLFCEMNDLVLNWKKISRGIPQGRHAANDRAPTLEELKKLIDYPDRRMKPIVYLMVSTGIRIGAFDTLQWKHISMISNKEGGMMVGKLVVYAGEAEEYSTVMSSEAYNAIKSWMDYRASYGEKITGESWVMRDLWQTTESRYGANYGVAKYPKRLKHSGVKSLLERALKAQGIFKPLPPGVRRREWKVAHGIRKFTNTMMIKARVSPLIKEMLLGHKTGLEDNYFRPSFEDDIVPEYLKAIDLLTLDESTGLRRTIEEMRHRVDDSSSIKSELKEKDEQIKRLSEYNQTNMDVIASMGDKLDELTKRMNAIGKD
jgi:integrase